jgi:predicted nucleic acid-binding protein
MQCAFDLLSEFPVLHTTDDTAELLASLKYEYQKLGRKKSFTDMLIATQALEHKLTLVTLDKDFTDITEIKKIIF